MNEYRWLITGGLACLAACGSLTLPGSHLADHWGGEGVGLVATATVVQFQNPCLRADFPGPVVPAADGTFTAEGLVVAASPPEIIGLPAQIAGRVVGDVVTLSVHFGTATDGLNPDTRPVSLQRGAPPHWPTGGGGCLH